jgi:hypothetical protein
MGVKHALGDYCLFSDADCLFDEKFIRGYNTLINAFPESFIGGKRRRIPIRDQGNIKLDP